MANADQFNEQAHPSSDQVAAHLAAAQGPVWVSQTAAGPPVRLVKESTMAANHLYWLNLHNAALLHFVDFIVTFKAGSPLTTQRQSFVFPAGYAGSITTPFGVPFWGGNPILGPAKLTVLANGLSVGVWDFQVTP